MNLNYVKVVLDRDNPIHTYDTSWRTFYNELWTCLETHTLTEIKQELRDNNCTVPFFCVGYLDKVYLRKHCQEVMIDGEIYQFHTNSPAVDDLMIILTTSEGMTIYRHYSNNSLQYGDYYIEQWIAYGHECEECGTLYVEDPNSIRTTGHNPNEELCPVCRLGDEPMAYSTRVEELLPKEETKQTLFGIELEYEKIRAKDVYKHLKGHALPKSDGSINNGVEVVTRPASMKTHKETLKAFYTSLNPKGEPNTGMHVHIDRSKLSQIQIGTIMQFINNQQNKDYITVIAGRSFATNHYCQAKPEQNLTHGIAYDENTGKLTRSGSGKYSAVNTDKRHTIELRIFSSPDSHEELCAKLDFVQALVDFSSPYSIDVKTIKDKFQWGTFKEFINKNRKQYIDLFTFYKTLFI